MSRVEPSILALIFPVVTTLGAATIAVVGTLLGARMARGGVERQIARDDLHASVARETAYLCEMQQLAAGVVTAARRVVHIFYYEFPRDGASLADTLPRWRERLEAANRQAEAAIELFEIRVEQPALRHECIEIYSDVSELLMVVYGAERAQKIDDHDATISRECLEGRIGRFKKLSHELLATRAQREQREQLESAGHQASHNDRYL